MKIKYCKKCSNISKEELQKAFPKAEIKEKCVGYCKYDKEKHFVEVHGDIIKAKSKDRLYEKIKEAK